MPNVTLNCYSSPPHYYSYLSLQCAACACVRDVCELCEAIARLGNDSSKAGRSKRTILFFYFYFFKGLMYYCYDYYCRIGPNFPQLATRRASNRRPAASLEQTNRVRLHLPKSNFAASGRPIKTRSYLRRDSLIDSFPLDPTSFAPPLPLLWGFASCRSTCAVRPLVHFEPFNRCCLPPPPPPPPPQTC